METWQNMYLISRGAELLELITCNPALQESLVGQGMLALNEQEQIEAARKAEGNCHASQILLRILRTRRHGYEVLLQVLTELKQTGATRILEDGIQQYSPAHLEARVQNEITQQCSLTIPGSLDYYISRCVLSRKQLFRKIFSSTADILVIRGIELNDMANLTDCFDKSSNELQRRELKYRRIILDNEDHFEKICKKSKVSVHLLQYQDKKFFWVKSHGPFGSIHENIHKEQDCFSEDDFISTCLETNPEEHVCISDTPGMGKTILLGNIARKITKASPETTVIFLILRDFMEDLHKIMKSDTGSKCIHEIHLVQAINDAITKKGVGNSCFMGFLKGRSYHLMLDGFDEILHDHRATAKLLLIFIMKALKNVRIWITTRPHLLHEVESILGVLGYNVLPFQRENQISFLHLFWVGKGAIGNERLDCYSSTCLTALNSQMSKTDGEVTGIPLKCRMLAEVFEDDAIGYSKYCSNHVVTPVASFTEMYDKFVGKQFGKFQSNFGGSYAALIEIHTKLAVELLFPELSNVFHDFALPLEERDLLLDVCNSGVVEQRSVNETPKFVHQTFAEYFVAKRVVDILNASTMTSYPSNMSTTEFWKKAFKILSVIFDTKKSESWYVRLDLQKGQNPSYNFKYPTLCYFINTLFRTTKEFQFPSNVIIPDEYQTRIRDWIPAAIEGNLLEIIKLFEQLFSPSVKELYLYDKKQVHVSLLISSIGTTSIDMVEFVSKWVETWGKTSLSSLQPHRQDWWYLEFLESVDDFREGNEIPYDYSLAGYAATMGSFLMFNFLFSKFNLSSWIGRDLWGASALLRCALNDSALSSMDIIEEKKQIVKHILGVNKTFLEKLEDTWVEVHLNIHPELSIFLLTEAWNVHPTVRLGPCVLHQTLDCSSAQGKLSGHHFHSLISMLCDKGFTYKELNTMKLLNRRTLLHAATTLVDELQEDTLEMLFNVRADFNSVGADGYSVLQLAKLNCDEKIVKKLKELGAIDRFLTLSRIKSIFRIY